MLINCPECNVQVSDKAISCPTCGYPINLPSNSIKAENKPSVASQGHSVRKHMRLPNGYGSIRKLTGSRRYPFGAYPPIKEYRDNGTAVMPKAIGYYKTYNEAYEALVDWHKNPWDVDKAHLTFTQVFEMFFEKEQQDTKLSKSTITNDRVAFKHCAAIHNRIYSELTADDYDQIINGTEDLGYSLAKLTKNMLSKLSKYALANDIIQKNYIQYVELKKQNDNEPGEPFYEDELEILWNNADDPTVQTILIMIYSGFRISAYTCMDEINLEEAYFKGGVKTKASRHRIVPIHPAIIDFVKPNIIDHKLDERNWRVRHFHPTLQRLGLETSRSGYKHTPHDCRHTFSWLCDKYGVDQKTKAMLMGHSLGSSVEERVYTHRTIEELRSAVNSIRTV